MKITKVAAAVITATALFMQAPSVLASDTSSAIRGHVVDASGTSLSNVTIEITHQPTGTVKTLTTSEGGIFQVRGLQLVALTRLKLLVVQR